MSMLMYDAAQLSCGCNFIIQEALISNVTIQLRASSCHMFSYGAVHVIALCSILFKKK